MRTMALWTTQKEEDAMRIIRSKRELEKARFRGRKPDKLIVPADDMKYVKEKDLKKQIAYTGVILILGRTKPLYDGRVSSAGIKIV